MDMTSFLNAFANPAIAERYWMSIVSGAWVTLQVAFAVIITGILLGFLLASIRYYRIRPINFLIVAFVDVFRGIPPLVAILLVFFGLPNVGIYLSAFVVLWLVLSLVLAAFSEEIFWAGLLSIPKGQWEAARSTGLGFRDSLLIVMMPQAIRIAIPPLTNRTMAITKNSSLGMVIGVPEILNEASTALSFSGNATPLMMGAVAYLIIFIPFVWLGRSLERRFKWKRS